MTRRAFRQGLWIAAVLIAGCGGPPAPRTPAPPAAAPAGRSATAQPDSEAVRWIRDSAEFHAAALQTYAMATRRVEQAAAAQTPGRWAVVLDADETLINNVQYQVERGRAGLGFSQESWTAWVRRRAATPIPGAATFLARTRALGGRIAIVTNRYDYECDDTIAVLRQHALVHDVVLCRPSGEPSDKNPRFERVAGGQTPIGGPPLEIVAFIGDNILDFPAMTQAARQRGDAALRAFGERFFLVPNPMYGSWQ